MSTDVRAEAPPAALVVAMSAELAAPVSVPRDRDPAAVYLASLGSEKSRRTMRGVLELVARELGAPGLEDVPWVALRYQHVAALRARLSGAGRAPATVNKVLSALRGVAREAMRLGLLSAEEYARIKDVDGVRGARLPAGRHLESGELDALFAACPAGATSAAGVRDAALLAVLRVAGLRRAELAALDLMHLHEGAWTLRVLGKGNKERKAFVAEASAELVAWLEVRGQGPGPLFCAVSKAGRPTGRRLAESSVAFILARLAARAGVEAFSPHDVRRTFVGDLLDAGADVGAVQRLAGHAQVATTLRYDRRGDRAAQKAAALLKVPRRS